MELANKKILVTGGAGFIGSNLVDMLIRQGNDVVVLDDFSTGKPENLESAMATGRLELIEGSILNLPLLQEIIPKVTIVFHLAVQCLRICFDQPHLAHEVNATGTLNLLEVTQRLNPEIERFIYVSSSEAYGTGKTVPMQETHEMEPTTVYGASKLAGELYTQAYFITYGMPTMVLRPFNTYGFREHHEGASGEVIPRFVVRIMNNLPPIIFGDGSHTRDFTFVSETAEGLIRAASCQAFLGQSVNIARGEEVSIRDVADKLLLLLDKQSLGVEWHPERPADVRRHYADVSKLHQVAGYRPQITIDEGLKMYVNWFQQHYNNPEILLNEFNTVNWKQGDANQH